MQTEHAPTFKYRALDMPAIVSYAVCCTVGPSPTPVLQKYSDDMCIFLYVSTEKTHTVIRSAGLTLGRPEKLQTECGNTAHFRLGGAK